jgi:hypothetical protein
MDFMATLLQQLHFCKLISRVFLFGCALALATIVSPQEALAQTTTICKQTIPPGSTTAFAFTGNNGASVPSFASLHGPIPPLQDSTNAPSNCWTFNIHNTDQYNAITETVPSGWALTNISCTYPSVRYDVGPTTPSGNNIGGTSAFQFGDNTVRFDSPPRPVPSSISGPARSWWRSSSAPTLRGSGAPCLSQ